ncbi:MAG: ATP-binding protein [Candidatus Zixiibacteriota bacterium]
MNITVAEKIKVGIIGAITALTLGIHYGIILEPIFGDSHWIHAIHGRFCYIPIVIAAIWFGIRGGLYVATTISVLVMPLIFGSDLGEHNFAGEMVEILFYFAIAGLTGGLVERELLARKKQEDMRLQLERSKQLSRVGQIAAGVAHEIKNPLASIKGAIEIINDDQTSDRERAEFNSILIKEVKRMDATITEFLAFARPRETRKTRIDLSETIRRSVKQIEAHANREGISVFSDICNGSNISGDEEKIHEMTLNILLNSVQVSPRGSTIRVTMEETSDKYASIRFEDCGPGIEDKNIDKVFDPFFTTKSSGTGLGLAIVKSIVDAHDGKITIKSKKDLGTTVEVLLPLYGRKVLR